jgi:Xaa-Pro aminopeptidase
VLISRRKAWLITDDRYSLAIRSRRDLGRDFDLIVRRGPLEPMIREALLREKVHTLGFDPRRTSVQRLADLRKGLPGIGLKAFDGPVTGLRAVKSDDELGLIERSLAVTEHAFKKTLSVIKPGISEMEIKTELEYRMARDGSEKPAFDTIIGSGPNAAVPHHRTGKRKVRKGDMIIMDFGAVVDGYYSDLTRTVFVGRPDAVYRERYQAVRDAMERVEESARHGMTCPEADAIARKVLESKGLAKYFTHSLGHGVGVEIHEAPSLNPRSPETLEAGMVVTVEPGIYIEGWGGIRIEDMVSVGKKKSRVLNSLSRDIWRV